jgi:hypothetical protein
MWTAKKLMCHRRSGQDVSLENACDSVSGSQQLSDDRLHVVFRMHEGFSGSFVRSSIDSRLPMALGN